MGDRANFGFRQADGNVIFVYGHWAGHQMMDRLAWALDRALGAGRLGDEAYANRIAISQLIGGDWNGDLSWGITVNYLSDNEHTIPIVDWRREEVSLYDYDIDPRSFVVTMTSNDTPKVTFSIPDFIKRYAKVGV